MNRRTFVSSVAAAACTPFVVGCRRPPCSSMGDARASCTASPPPAPNAASAEQPAARAGRRPLELIEAPSNLGLRPLRPGHVPGTWRAPEVLAGAGLIEAVKPSRRAQLPRPEYRADAQPGTRIRNGHSLRAFNLQLGAEVEASLSRGALPLVIGGDCSNLLGSMVGLRHAGGRGLIHVDGHSDFSHPGNYDSLSRLGSAAGMDLALVTGFGEELLTRWPDVEGPLVADVDAVQLGERNADAPEYYKGLTATKIERITVQWAKEQGVVAAVERSLGRLAERELSRAWLHVDLDVLDERVFPAVDSPGRPGFGFEELGELLRRFLESGRIAGLDVAIYDPDLDPDGAYARGVVKMLGAALS